MWETGMRPEEVYRIRVETIDIDGAFIFNPMLGHSRIQMVMRYAHPTEEHQFQAMRKIEAFTAAR
jgi:integrase